LVRVVAVGAAHDDAPALPAIESLAVRAAGPCFGLGEVALRTHPVCMIECRTLTVLQGKQLNVVRRMTGSARCAGLRRMIRLDILMSVGDALIAQHHAAPEMAGRAWILTQVR
jgi:hypothetical protein